MHLLYAILLGLPVGASPGLRDQQRAHAVRLCEAVLDMGAFDLDAAIAAALVVEALPGVYQFSGTKNHVVELRALSRLLDANGGRALAMGNLGLYKGLPFIDGIYFPPTGPRRLISIKSSSGTQEDGVKFILNYYFSRRSITLHFSRVGLEALYRVGGRHETQRLVDSLVKIWGLNEPTPPKITLLLDLSTLTGIKPRLRPSAEAFAARAPTAWRGDDIVLQTVADLHDGGREAPSRGFNLDLAVRGLKQDRHWAGLMVLFDGSYLEVGPDGHDLRQLP